MSDTLWLAVITGVFGLLNSILAALVLRSNSTIHTIVNQQRTDMVSEIRSLKEEKVNAKEVARLLAEKVKEGAVVSAEVPVNVKTIAPEAAQAIKDATRK